MSGPASAARREATTTAAGNRWRELLAAWAIPAEILAAAPADPHAIPTHLFDPQHQTCSTVAVDAAAAALPNDGTVLDVGCASGAASLPLAALASHVTGVDADPAMVALFERVATAYPIDTAAVTGRWPDVAPLVEVHDVVVSHHVVYNVTELEAFVLELTAHARHRVVLEVTPRHPQTELSGLWQRFHGITRPTRPALEDLLAVLQEVGIRPVVTAASRPAPPQRQPRRLLVAFARRRLCLDPSEDPVIDAALPPDHVVPPPEVVCLWWDGRPRRPAPDGS
ncbi:MAG: class I SAM-dependent methyltransferase [Acidimicrobiales bacterium]|jgi:SAM-dependent methyltransferase|nr:class I SAM-dependent methyltransferase [Acidimicrobiales bacterium]